MAVSTSKKKRASSFLQSPAAQKHHRTAPHKSHGALHYERLDGVPFPAKIVALPHILTLIDELLMAPQEAAKAAATTSQAGWLRELLLRFGRSIVNTEMLTVAAADGHEEVVKALLPALACTHYQKNADLHKRILAAVVIAGEKGHLGILKLLLPETKLEIFHEYDSRKLEVVTVIQQAIDKAAGHGHVDVVKFIAQHALEKQYKRTLESSSKALSCAIAGGNSHVTEFLLSLDGFRWNMAHALDMAVTMGQTTLAERLEGTYQNLNEGPDLLVRLAREGYSDGVKYLYQKVHGNTELVHFAFVGAAESDQNDIAGRIPSETIEQAFVVAARHGNIDAVECLRSSHRISSEAVGKAFMGAAECGHLNMMQALQNQQQRYSAEVILQAFSSAAARENLPMLKCVTQLIIDEKHVPRKFRYKAFVDAAQNQWMKALRVLNKTENGNIPLDVLKQAHDVATHVGVKTFIYKLTCAQLFDPNYKGRFDAVVHAMQQWKNVSIDAKQV
ncbi:hypothetical protein PHYPSEUDO_008550 [Phytophthora pseudosyringae]|uniref:Ankyrin repeat-containing domain n=1 Tax=Phytophthora pseudosyringae TaxID=221518 RepID=A0A8T1VET9_9STRA|nr:hypothetical protein PHYPSEUDO_008550 [Phytophthora pseudosyringae]